MNSSTPTTEQSEAYQKAYDYLNIMLFKKELPNCLLSISAKAGSYGCFLPDKWEKADQSISGIQLTPVTLECPTRDLLAVLCRQMVNVWQYYCGSKKPARVGYCNDEWKQKMREIGLIPVGTGNNWNVDHIIDEDGEFAQAMKIVNSDTLIPWKARPSDEPEKKTGGKRVKYTCPLCRLNVWSRSGARIKCGDCEKLMIPSE